MNGKPRRGVVVGAVLLFAQRTSGARRSVMVTSAVLAAVAVVVSGGAQGFSSETAVSVYSITVILLCLATITTIGVHVLRDPSLDVHIVLGVIAVYVLLGIAFAGAYSVVGIAQGGFFAQGGADDDAVNYFYFSLITITTTGFGDLSPVTDTGKILAALEALIGQVYLVTVVALAVSGVTRRRRA